jgi:outer membrane lipoprotein-sorting protein
MNNFSESLIFRMGRLLCALTCLLACLPSFAQQTAPLSADEVIARVVEMNEVRAKALENYSSIRSYHLECHCLSHKKADMLVRVDYQAPNQKEFTILSESGSGAVRNKVFKKLLEAEKESTQEENQQRSAITLDNYTFSIADYQKTEANEVYILSAQPRNKNKFLFRGRIWVDAKDFGITRVEGEPAVNPSWWTVRTDFKRSYEKLGSFYLPESNESTTKVRIFGTAVLTINYGDYQITQVPDGNGSPTVVKPLDEVDAAHQRANTLSPIDLKDQSEVAGNHVRQ